MTSEDKVSEGEYTYVYGNDISRKRAEQMALEKAREDAIGRAFGSIISSEGSIEMSNMNGNASMSFYKTGSSELWGEWLRDVERPKFKRHIDDETGLDAVTCQVKGLVRAVNHAPVQFEWHLLRNHIDKDSESAYFANEDKLYMTFEAPCDGFLAVYLVDERGMAQCLIPNEEEPEGIYRIKHDKEYVFFSNEVDNEDDMIPPHLLTTFTFEQEEYNQIYVFFSPNKFVKSNVREPYIDRGRMLPAEIEFKAFQNWQKSLHRDPGLQREKKIISIKRSND